MAQHFHQMDKQPKYVEIVGYLCLVCTTVPVPNVFHQSSYLSFLPQTTVAVSTFYSGGILQQGGSFQGSYCTACEKTFNRMLQQIMQLRDLCTKRKEQLASTFLRNCKYTFTKSYFCVVLFNRKDTETLYGHSDNKTLKQKLHI